MSRDRMDGAIQRMTGARVLLVALALGSGAVAAPSSVAAQVDTTHPVAEVRVSASADRSVRPDLAIVTLTLHGEGATPLAATRAVAARVDSVRRALQSLGIPRDSLITRSQWYWWAGRIETVLGPGRWVVDSAHPTIVVGGRQIANGSVVRDTLYRAHDAIEVHIRDIARAGAVIDTAAAHGITDISGIQFRATDVSRVQEDALREATESARRKAAVIAAAGGGRLGRTLLLSTDADRGYENPFLSAVTVTSAGGGSASSSSGTDVVRPSILVRVTVSGRWELLDSAH